MAIQNVTDDHFEQLTNGIKKFQSLTNILNEEEIEIRMSFVRSHANNFPEVPTNRNFGIVSVLADLSDRLHRKGEEKQNATNDDRKNSKKPSKQSESIEKRVGRTEDIRGLAEK
jgi:hypothetical protein